MAVVLSYRTPDEHSAQSMAEVREWENERVGGLDRLDFSRFRSVESTMLLALNGGGIAMEREARKKPSFHYISEGKKVVDVFVIF